MKYGIITAAIETFVWTMKQVWYYLENTTSDKTIISNDWLGLATIQGVRHNGLLSASGSINYFDLTVIISKL